LSLPLIRPLLRFLVSVSFAPRDLQPALAESAEPMSAEVDQFVDVVEGEVLPYRA
jgi:hypothetical protein